MLKIIGQSFVMSLQNIRSNKMRSFLTMLGIMIGVGSVIALITIVNSATSSVMDSFESLGEGTITLTVSGTDDKAGLSDSDLDSLREVEGVAGLTPVVSTSTTVVYNREIYNRVTVQGYDASYFLYNDIIETGRALNNADIENLSRVCIVDATFVENVLGGVAAIGDTIELNGSTYTIIGIQSEDESLVSSMMGTSNNSNGSMIIPYKNVLRMSRSAYINSVTVYIDDDYDSDTVEENLSILLDELFYEEDDAYSIADMSSLSDTMDSVEDMLTMMLAGIASISLVVGGIGIMNMMLVSVSERKQEIGLRKAMGAVPFRIQIQFLIESICLSMLGGIAGVIVGILIAIIGCSLMSTTFSLSMSAVYLGLGFSAAVGIIFGWAPARNASRLNPIDALRSE